jgi:hypothetical protein
MATLIPCTVDTTPMAAEIKSVGFSVGFLRPIFQRGFNRQNIINTIMFPFFQ